MTSTDNEGWVELSPWALKKSDDPRVTIRAALAGKHKAPITYIGINRPLINQLKWDVSGKALATIEMGSGLNSGKMRITQSPKGRFKLAASGTSSGNKNGVRMVVRIPHQAAQQSTPQVLDFSVVGNTLVVSIPEKWTNTVQVKPYSAESVGVTSMTAPAQKPKTEVTRPAVAVKTTHTPKPERTDEPVLVEVKSDVAEMLLESGQFKPVDQKPTAQTTPCVDLKLVGRVLAVGQTPINLMADEIQIMKLMIERFGEKVTNGTLQSLEKTANITLMRLKQKLKTSKVVLVQRTGGWSLVNHDSPLLALGETA